MQKTVHEEAEAGAGSPGNLREHDAERTAQSRRVHETQQEGVSPASRGQGQESGRVRMWRDNLLQEPSKSLIPKKAFDPRGRALRPRDLNPAQPLSEWVLRGLFRF